MEVKKYSAYLSGFLVIVVAILFGCSRLRSNEDTGGGTGGHGHCFFFLIGPAVARRLPNLKFNRDSLLFCAF